MGTCASTNVNGIPQRIRDPNQRPSTLDKNNVSCGRHGNTVTHINLKTEDLFCLSCYQDYKGRHTRAEHIQVSEITEYLKTIQFKQSEIQALEKLRNNKYTKEHRIFQITQIKNKLENKRNQILNEIKQFVNTVIELVRHLEDEITGDANRVILAAVNEVKAYQNKLQTDLDTLIKFENEIKTNRDNGKNAGRLKTVINCKNYLKKNANSRDETKDYDPTLKLNKDITLNEIIGKEKDAKKVSLGFVTCENKRTRANFDELSDISEDGSDDTVYTKRSTTQQTNSTSGTNSSQRFTADSTRNVTPTASTNATYETKTRQSPCLDNNLSSYVQVKPGNVLNVSGMCHESQCNQIEEIDKTNSEVTDRQPEGEKNDKSQQRLQFLRDSALSRNVSRRRSSVGTPSRKTPTPRRSSQSIVSPGNITSPYFISPRPSQRKEPMDRRIAARFRDIQLPRDENISNITDTAQLGDGGIVLCDEKNEKMLLMNEQFEIVSEIKLSGHPHNVTNVPDNTRRIAVTIPDENMIKVVEVIDEVFDEKIELIRLQSKPKCRGIDYVDGNLLYTTRNDVAVLRKDDRSRTWKFKYAFRDPVSLFADRRNDVIYVSCLGLKSFGEVVKMHFKDEKIDFVISCNEIQHPVCSTMDGEGYIYICDIDPPSIHQVSPDGKYCRRLLSASEGKFQHVSFIRGTDMFIATENDSDTVHIYEMA